MAVVAIQKPKPRPAGRGGEVLLEISRLEKAFPNGTQALRGIDLKLSAGELTVVLGANGSGKSTLLRCLVRLIDPTGGSVHVNGSDLAHLDGIALREARRAVAMVFQHANLVRRRTALANVIMGALAGYDDWKTALGFLPSAEREPARRCLERVGLAHVAGQRADTLSGGQAQRVAIARGLNQRPRVLLADEPVASLDPEAAEEVMSLLLALAENEGLAVLCVLHQPDLAVRYGHRIIGMRDGRIVFDQPAQSVDRDAVDMLYRGEAA
ncbi:MAG: phosphonate ABC transporter ATP-binding protein [Chloroflexi bacterium]|nr:phosphonate ABC transporter ATP-binding protein [Chloroflexota bacterium]